MTAALSASAGNSPYIARVYDYLPAPGQFVNVFPAYRPGYTQDSIIAQLEAALVGKTNANAMSDLGVSALSVGAAIRGAWLNVLINVGGIKDEAMANHYRADGKALLEKGMALSEAIYQKIEAAL